MRLEPSLQQLETFDATAPGRLVLYYQLGHAEPGQGAECVRALAVCARRCRGELRWAAREEQVLCGRMERFGHACAIHFKAREHARYFVYSSEHRAAVSRCTALHVAVLSEQPRLLALTSTLMALLLPRWPFDNTVEPGEEPGVDVSSVMPTSAAIAALRAHPEQHEPIVMVNWLKFRPGSGRADYHRYGKVAMLTTHSLGAKLLFASRYRQVLIGHDGDPAREAWDEFALMQYPGRATFARMASLRRYRRALHHREAGLAEHGQGLTVTRPLPEPVRRGVTAARSAAAPGAAADA